MVFLIEDNNINPWRRMSVPFLNKIDSQEFIDGRYFSHGKKFLSSLSRKSVSGESINKQGKSQFSSTLSLNRSSTYEKSKSVSSVPSVDTVQKTSDSNFLNVCHGSSQSINKSCGDVSTGLNAITTLMTQANSVSRGPADPEGSAGAPIPLKNFDSTELIHTSRSSKARQKKFHRHFKQVDIGEKVLNYYSCALVGDILLQGHLYITENFFAFYSNVFGYVTKLLIPTVDVLKISKEKTAKIIPNAVGISTEDEKHVFGSLLSRDSTYKFMMQVWKAANSSNPVVSITPPPTIKTEMPSDEDSTATSGNEEPSSYVSNLTTGASSENLQKLLPTLKRRSTLIEMKNSRQHWKSFRINFILGVSVALLVLLIGSAGYLLYRIAIIQNHFQDLTISSRSNELHEDIIKWQSALHSTSANKIYEFLNTNLHQIIKIRLSLEALSMLILPVNNTSEKSNLHSKLRIPNDSNERRPARKNSNH